MTVGKRDRCFPVPHCRLRFHGGGGGHFLRCEAPYLVVSDCFRHDIPDFIPRYVPVAYFQNETGKPDVIGSAACHGNFSCLCASACVNGPFGGTAVIAVNGDVHVPDPDGVGTRKRLTGKLDFRAGEQPRRKQ